MPLPPGTVIATIPAGVATSIATSIANSASTSTDNEVTWEPTCVPSSLTVISTLVDATHLQDCTTMIIDGNYAYVVLDANPGRLSIFDISDPTNMTFVSTLVDSRIQDSWGLVKDGDYCYVTSRAFGFSVIDVSNPFSPSIVGFLDLGPTTDFDGFPDRVVKDGNYCYIAASIFDGFIIVVNVSNPTAPSVTGYWEEDVKLESAFSIAKQGNYCYIASLEDKNFAANDVSNPAAPHTVSFIPLGTAGGLVDLIADGNYVYGVGWAGMFSVFDVSNPLAMTHVAQLPDTGPLDGAISFVKIGDFFYFGSVGDPVGNVCIVDVSAPTAPVLSGITLYDSVNLNGACAIAASGSTLFVACRTEGRLTSVGIFGTNCS